MYNWDYNLKETNKKDPEYIRWQIQRQINYGLGNTKLNPVLVKKHWTKLKIDPAKKQYLARLLWQKK
jgi:hypothetical protein